MDLKGKDPLVESSAEWMRATSSGRHRMQERHRVRRRARRPNTVRAKIRMRVWLACTGALFVMVLVIYLAIGREHSAEAGYRLGVPAAPTLASAAVTSALG